MATPTSQLILETSDLVKIFNRFDSNNDGKISASELESVLEALGSSTSPEELKTLMAQIDSDGDGFINLEEFAEFYAGGTGGERSASEELKEAFEAYDADRNGQISAAELHMVLLKLGESCSVEDCERMIVCVDSDGDGSVSFEEFVGMMNGVRAVSN